MVSITKTSGVGTAQLLTGAAWTVTRNGHKIGTVARATGDRWFSVRNVNGEDGADAIIGSHASQASAVASLVANAALNAFLAGCWRS